ncbi:Spo0E family sporulation regulatory protein-aspartic acid phosphatase (plasmid) [Metabacillus halosaccharovorans]|uniref:aspartyl-phosphate phosphatase Spo0E family protein n=1 Tax=Bacillaceae TaxID=186817 RepID=UPI00114599B1|nr:MULTISPECIES: aspartyl-phosphate phosphatase Spo0E family protein [Bacillaceae]UGB33571.1 aspartyl-phosphate phosphatase Spo0E family protein [Metabacillus sp. B2-18]
MENTKEQLSNNIELVREEMIQAVVKYGLQNERTVKLSQKLDRLIVAFQKSTLKSSCDNSVCLRKSKLG